MTNKKRIITFFILMMIGFIVIFAGLWIRENRVTIINVEGHEIEYHPTDRKLSEMLGEIKLFGENGQGSSFDEISDKLGEPDAWVGTGTTQRPVYFLEDNRVAVFHFLGASDLWNLREIALYRENGDIRVIEADTEQMEESSESIRHFFNTITDDMLNACETDPYSHSYWNAYWNAPLILLSEFNENNENVRLYGISVAKETAMLLAIGGEKVLIEYPFRNLFEELPGLNIRDSDSDGMDEVIISMRTACYEFRRYALLVCDHEKKWNVYTYDDYLKDVEDIIKYRYENGIFTFLDDDGNVLWESNWDPTPALELEDVNFENDMGFHVREIAPDIVIDDSLLIFQNGSFSTKTIQMDIVPEIKLEGYGPVRPIRIVFFVRYADGDFDITGYAGYWRANRK